MKGLQIGDTGFRGHAKCAYIWKVVRILLTAALFLLSAPAAFASGHGHHGAHVTPKASSAEMHATEGGSQTLDHHEPTASSHVLVCLETNASASAHAGHDDCLGCCPDHAGASDVASIVRPEMARHAAILSAPASGTGSRANAFRWAATPSRTASSTLFCVLRL